MVLAVVLFTVVHPLQVGPGGAHSLPGRAPPSLCYVTILYHVHEFVNSQYTSINTSSSQYPARYGRKTLKLIRQDYLPQSRTDKLTP
jgi:hypothetical protein